MAPIPPAPALEDEADISSEVMGLQLTEGDAEADDETEVAQWQPLEFNSRSPGSRVFPSAVVHGGSLYVFGGHDGTVYRNDLLVFNFETRSWRTQQDMAGEPPSSRDAHAAVVHVRARAADPPRLRDPRREAAARVRARIAPDAVLTRMDAVFSCDCASCRAARARPMRDLALARGVAPGLRGGGQLRLWSVDVIDVLVGLSDLVSRWARAGAGGVDGRVRRLRLEALPERLPSLPPGLGDVVADPARRRERAVRARRPHRSRALRADVRLRYAHRAGRQLGMCGERREGRGPRACCAGLACSPWRPQPPSSPALALEGTSRARCRRWP